MSTPGLHCRCRWAAVVILTVCLARAEVRLAPVFGDGMVLQRELPIFVWGQADPGEQVVVRFADQERSARANPNGAWQVELAPRAASRDGAMLTVRGTNEVQIRHVLVGEVWLCAGQSNMEVGLERSKTSATVTAAERADVLARVTEELERSTPALRVVRFNPKPMDPHRGKWLVADHTALAQVREGVQGFSAVGYFFGRAVHAALDVPVGLISTAVGGTRIEEWMPPTGRHFTQLVRPLIPFSIRGVVWYQGESNVIAGDTGPAYAAKQRELIRSWRGLWRDFPFYYVQLPPMAYARRRGSPLLTNLALPHLREGQAAVLSEPGTGMVVTLDLADSLDLHPANKWDVGDRLARLALTRTYGRSGIVASGPVFRSVRAVAAGRTVVEFEPAAGALRTRDGEPVRDFQVAGEDGVFRSAEATIVGSSVELRHPDLTRPVAVRFAWEDTARPNLVNAAGLPAAPFRTDDWPVTVIRPPASAK